VGLSIMVEENQGNCGDEHRSEESHTADVKAQQGREMQFFCG